MAKKRTMLPSKDTVKQRITSVNKGIAGSIDPRFDGVVSETRDDFKDRLDALEIVEGQCAYCCSLNVAILQNDHIHPLVKDSIPTGYISEPHNLAPSCSKCNGNKGNLEFSEWYDSDKNMKRMIEINPSLTVEEIKRRKRLIMNWSDPSKCHPYHLTNNEKNELISYQKELAITIDKIENWCKSIKLKKYNK